MLHAVQCRHGAAPVCVCVCDTCVCGCVHVSTTAQKYLIFTPPFVDNVPKPMVTINKHSHMC